MSSYPNSSFINRFTTLPVVLHMLLTRTFTLLEPTHWEDRNDAYYLEKYKSEKNLKTLVAACFSTKRETFHHWKVFASGSSGVCVEFRTNGFLRHFENIGGVSFKEVSYKLIKYNNNPSLNAWPFLKRHAFKDEGEFRIIYENVTEEHSSKSFEIDLNCIEKVTLSPWLPKAIAESIFKIVRRINGCDGIKINRSSLLESRKWKDCIWTSNYS